MTGILVVAAHPDDEVLGCGGTIARHVATGDSVDVLFLADGVTSRQGKRTSALAQRSAAARCACDILGARAPRFFQFPDNRLDSVPLLEVVKLLETVLAETGPRILYTHHGGDLNVDHRIAHQVVMTACRPQPGSSVKGIYSFEVPSSTDWSSQVSSAPFRPNHFVDVTDHFARKMQALEAYQEELRAFPHARSREVVEALARVRGASVGVVAAEAFGVERQLVT